MTSADDDTDDYTRETSMGPLGMPELVILFGVGVVWLLPVAAAIWALVTLQRVRSAQQAMALKLDSIERLLHGASRTP